MQPNQTRRAAFAAVTLLALAACAAPTPVAPTAVPAPTTVRVGYVPVIINAAIYRGIEAGYFLQEGINVELKPVEGGSDVVVQVANGNFDVGGGGIAAGMLNAVARGIEFEIVAPLHSEKPKLATAFVVSKKRFDSGEYKKVSDLKGKKVSVNSKGAATEYWLFSALKQAGLEYKDVEVVQVPFPNVAAALEKGGTEGIDGAMLTEPFTTLAVDQGLVVRLSDDFIDGFTPTYLYYNKDWAKKNPDLAARFVKAYIRGARDLQGDAWYNDANLAAFEKFTKVKADVQKRANRAYFDPNGEVPLKDIMTLQTFLRGTGALNYPADIDMSKFVNMAYRDAAVKALGAAK